MALWKSVADTVSTKPTAPSGEKDLLNSSAIERATESVPPPPAHKPPPKPQAAIRQRPPGPDRPAPLPAAPRAQVSDLGPSTPGLDRNTSRKLKQGRLPPEARIDLHGMTIARAHDALIGFILREHASGSRCVLVITGKGGRREERDSFDWRMSDRIGVLKSMTPQWLHQAPLSPLVVGVYPAHQSHGGAGAFYVYLRKTR